MKKLYDILVPFLKKYSWGENILEHIRRHPTIYEYVEAFLVALVLALVIRTFLLQPYKIPSGSMIPALKVGDRIFVFRLPYWFGAKPEVGDIVVFKVPKDINNYDPKKPVYIKRVVGLAGDEVEIKRGRIFVNGELIEDPPIFKEINYVHLVGGMDRPYYSRTVPEGRIYVFGDNSAHSYDSRAWGGVPYENIIGKAFFRYWPLWRIGLVR